MKKERTLEEDLFHIELVFLAVGFGLGLLYFLFLRGRLPEFPCFFSTVLGVYCPGCGGTRAVIALLHGHFLQSLWYHPMVLWTACIGGGFMLTQGMHRLGLNRVKGWRFHNWYLYGAITIIVGNFLLKNILRLGWGVEM